MKSRIVIAGTGALALTLVMALLALAVALPVAAEPGAQGTYPTPTPEPVENVEYDLSTVGGEDLTLTFDHGEVDGFTLGESTVTSTYPRGMVFTLAPQSPNGAVTDVILFMQFPNGERARVAAEYDESQERWIARPWELGEGAVAWIQFEFLWRVRDETDVSVDSEPIASEYWDPTRVWQRMDTPFYLVFWYGLDTPASDVADFLAFAIASTEQRRVDGFGQSLSYQPLGILYPTQQDYSETDAGGVTRPDVSGITLGGIALPQFSATVQFFLLNLRPNEETAIFGMGGTLTHELTHMYQADTRTRGGPTWWTEGQAEWFSFNPGLYDQRMINLATLQDFPTLRNEIGSQVAAADGRGRLEYDAGVSFVNWLVSVYGLETLAETLSQQSQGTPFLEALEAATGQTFLEIENGWRTYIGFTPLALEDVDPAAALDAYEDEMLAVGDTVTLPAMPPLVPLGEDPGERVLASGQCFGGMDVEVLAMGALDGIPYFQVDCMGMVGWVGRDVLAPGQ